MRTITVILVVLIGLVALDSYQNNGRYLNAASSMGSQLIHHFFRK